MNEERYLAVSDPEWIFIFDEEPPMGVSLHLLMEWGNCIKGHYNAEWGVIAWRALPKLTLEQKQRKLALIAQGYDLKRHHTKQTRKG